MGKRAARGIRRFGSAAAAAGGALALLGLLGLNTAYAEPTPDPTPAPSITPTPSPTESAISSSPAPLVEEVTPTPVPAAPGTPSSPAPSIETAMPSPTESATAPSPTSKGAPPAPIPTERPAPTSPAADSQGVEALAEPVADERLYVLVRTQCAGGEGEARVEVQLYLLTDEDRTLDYVLTDDGGITRTGTVALTPEDSDAPEDPHATLEFTRLPVGSYHIDFLPDGGKEPVTVQNFEVLTCLVTDVQCQQITFANPVTNPTVFLTYGEGPADDDDYRDFDLEPGERRAFRTDRGVIHWLAGTVEGGAEANVSIAYAGLGDEVSVPSDCEPTPPAADPGDGLADTGGNAYAMGGLIGGGVLTATGATLLRRRPT